MDQNEKSHNRTAADEAVANVTSPLLSDETDFALYEHTCAICYEVMVRPHAVRPCGHVFCETCLRRLQASTQGRPQRNPHQAGRDVKQYVVLVMCPCCRAGIDKCEYLDDKDAVIRATYPAAYKLEEKVLKSERRKQRDLALPSSATVIQPAGPSQQRHHHHNHRHQQHQGPRQNGRGLLVISWRQKFWKILGRIGFLSGWAVGIPILVTYMVFTYTTVGLCKVALQLTGRSGLVLTPERGQGPLTRWQIRGLSLTLLVITVKVWKSTTWSGFIFYSVPVISTAVVGFRRDGRFHETYFRVIKNIMF